MEAKVAQLCSTLSDPVGSTVHGILQARILKRVRGSFQPRDWTGVSCFAGGFFTSWATREVQKYWSGQSIPSPGNLPNPGINLASPALQADSLPTELSGKQLAKHMGKWSAYLVIQGMQIKTTATFAPMKDLNNDNAVFVQHGVRYIGNPRCSRHGGRSSDPFGK